MTHDFRLHRDADRKQTCIWRNVAGTGIVLTNVTLVANLKSFPERTTVNLAPSIEVVDAAAGEFDVVFTAAQTTALVKGKYVWEVLATLGTYVQRIFSGEILVLDTGGDVSASVTLVAVADPVVDSWVMSFV